MVTYREHRADKNWFRNYGAYDSTFEMYKGKHGETPRWRIRKMNHHWGILEQVGYGFQELGNIPKLKTLTEAKQYVLNHLAFKPSKIN